MNWLKIDYPIITWVTVTQVTVFTPDLASLIRFNARYIKVIDVLDVL